MQLKLPNRAYRLARIAAIALPAGLLICLLWRPLTQVAGLAAGAAALAFLIHPLAAVLERRLSRPMAALAALVVALSSLAALLWWLLPLILRELVQLARTLPAAVNQLTQWMDGLSGWVEARMPGLQLPEVDLGGVSGALSGIASGTIALAGSAGGAVSRLSLMVMLSYFFLCDRDRLLLRLELLTPQALRQTAVRMGRAVARELRLYLRGQLLISLAVGALSAAALMLVRVRSALVLGGIVGILNMVPYFGPFIGGIPAVIVALGDGLHRAGLAVLALTVVQQLDSAVISPRVMGSLTGFSPAAVLVAIYAGARLSGIVGMLIALPLFMSVRTVFRVFVQSYENI